MIVLGHLVLGGTWRDDNGTMLYTLYIYECNELMIQISRLVYCHIRSHSQNDMLVRKVKFLPTT